VQRKNVSAWVFQANPKLWDIDGALDADPLEIRWLVNQYEDQIRPGHRVFLWRAGRNAGILAVATVTSSPVPMPDDKGALRYAIQAEKFRGHRVRVLLRVERILEQPISRDAIRADGDLSSMAILSRPQGTNFPVTPAEEIALTRLIGLR
jgi:EVE domain